MMYIQRINEETEEGDRYCAEAYAAQKFFAMHFWKKGRF